MLTKLIKYEFRETGRLFMPVFGGALILLALTKLMNMFAQAMGTTDVSPVSDNFFATIINLASILLSGLLAVLMLALVLMTIVVAAQRFYKLLGDEGYSMFTLPVTPAQLIWSKTIVAAMWAFVAYLFDVLCIGVLGLWSSSGTIATAFGFESEAAMVAALWLSGVLAVLLLVACVVNLLLSINLCCSIGMHWPQRRLTCSVLMYFALGVVLQILGFITLLVMMLWSRTKMGTSFLFWLNDLALSNPIAFVNGLFAVVLLLLIAGSAIYFAVTRHLLSKKLNLA